MEILLLIVLLVVVTAGAVLLWKGGRRRPPDGEPLSGRAPGTGAPPESARLEPTGLRAKLTRSRDALGRRLAGIGSGGRLDETVWSDLEDLLIAADIGPTNAADLVAAVRREHPASADELRSVLQREMTRALSGRARELALEGHPAVILVVGVNGSGKTTSVAKLAGRLQGDGRRVLLGAGDTFRAAGSDQLRIWADRVGVDVVAGQDGADPAAVAFDALQAARARNADVLIVDTAGRLQTKSNLMAELGKVARVLEREVGTIDEVLLVLDGTTGQNALSQARSFADSAGLTGIVLTKLDGSSRGGAALAIEQEMGVPVKFIGIGEGIDDLVPFDPGAFVEALIGP